MMGLFLLFCFTLDSWGHLFIPTHIAITDNLILSTVRRASTIRAYQVEIVMRPASVNLIVVSGKAIAALNSYAIGHWSLLVKCYTCNIKLTTDLYGV